MTNDQLARVSPDGRTVHVPPAGNPLKGYEPARADIEKRGNGDDAATVSKPSLFARLFRGKSSDDDEEAGATAVTDKPAPATVVAAAASAKSVDTRSADAVPMPRSKPQVAATLQLPSADAHIVPAPKARPETRQAAADKAEPQPQSPADIINARGFWGDAPAAPNQATPAQVAALNARAAVGAADPQPTASVSAAFNKALASAPPPTSPAAPPTIAPPPPPT